MKRNAVYSLILGCIFLLPCLVSCKKDPVEFGNSEPVEYFLSADASLSLLAEPDDDWYYITNFIYPTTYTYCEWSVYLDHNLTEGEFAYDLLFWTASETVVKIEIILDDSGETILASRNLTIPYIDDQTAIQHACDIENSPLVGTNPLSGKGGSLIFRITYVSGEDPVEIFYDASPGNFGCSSITVYGDKQD